MRKTWNWMRRGGELLASRKGLEKVALEEGRSLISG